MQALAVRLERLGVRKRGDGAWEMTAGLPLTSLSGLAPSPHWQGGYRGTRCEGIRCRVTLRCFLAMGRDATGQGFPGQRYPRVMF